MGISTRATFAVTLLLGLGAAGATEDSFEANYAKAQANAATAQGAAYDAVLAAAYEAMPDFRRRLEACLRDNPGPHAVHGYFEFYTEKSFGVFLEPKDEFTFCLGPALASPSVPPPPSTPYLNPFTFTTSP